MSVDKKLPWLSESEKSAAIYEWLNVFAHVIFCEQCQKLMKTIRDHAYNDWKKAITR